MFRMLVTVVDLVGACQPAADVYADRAATGDEVLEHDEESFTRVDRERLRRRPLTAASERR